MSPSPHSGLPHCTPACFGGGAAGSREPRPSMSPAETHFISPSAYGDIHLYFSWRAHKDSDKWILFIKTEEGMQKNCKDSAYRQRREVWGCKGDVEACEFITSSYLSNFLNWRGDCTFSPLPPPQLLDLLLLSTPPEGSGEIGVGVNARESTSLISWQSIFWLRRVH